MFRRQLLTENLAAIDLDLTIDDLMHDLDPGWDQWTPSSQSAAADIAPLLAALA